MLEIPGELVDSIIDHLKLDTYALATCSLLSRQWLPRSRYILFVSVSFSIGRGNSKGPDRLDEFLDLLDSPLATFIPYVEEVRLSYHMDGLAGSSSQILASLHDRGVRPARLYLDCERHFYTLPPQGPPAFAASLVHLDLEVTENHVALDIIVDYICAFPRLESLRLTGPPKSMDHTPPGSMVLPPRLHTLYTDHPLIVDWILSLHPIPKQITTIRFDEFRHSAGHWLEVNKYLRNPAAENIQSLTLDFPSIKSGDPDFRNLQCLQHLTLHISSQSSLAHLVVVLPRLRASPASRTLQTIEIVLTSVPYASQHWTTVDAELAESAHYPRLRCITLAAVDTTQDFFLGPIADLLQRQFQHCARRGILRISTVASGSFAVTRPLFSVNAPIALQRRFLLDSTA
ncbi:hypothetical protein DFH06DRAFT_1107180 [Mycena polygramma]|nr:hypothetical protein DFH06DRAFT_1107180 [Mycena polygramma]